MRRAIKRRTSNDYWVIGYVALIDVSTKQWPYAVAMIDLDDLTSVIDGGRRWYAYKGPNDNTLYTKRSVPGSTNKEHLHRILTPDLGDLNPDHLNHDGLDNRKSNLRPATVWQNRLNSRNACGSSQYVGVSWCKKTRRWRAQIKLRGNANAYLGRFDNEEDAALAYNRAIGDNVNTL